MAYKSGEEGLETLVEVPYSGDGRLTENFSTSTYKKAGAAWNQPYIKYASTYPYIEGFSKYKKAGSIFLCKKGTRPALKYRGNVVSGSGYLTKESDGSVIFTPDGGSGVEIFPASLNVKWFIMDLVGGGGGGAGQNSSVSGGGGGGGGYALSLVNFISTSSRWRIVLGNGGPGGVGWELGADGNSSYLKYGSGTTVLTCTGGKGGTVGSKLSPGGYYGYAFTSGIYLTNYSYGYCIKQVNGGRGGDKGNSGENVFYSYTIPSPEETSREYTVYGGAGTTNSGGGGGASAVAAGGRGGSYLDFDKNGVSGQFGSGGGGACWARDTYHGGAGGNGYASFYY